MTSSSAVWAGESERRPLRIVQLSDIHIWRRVWDPRALWGKRFVGMAELLAGRARRFRLERLEAVVDRVLSVRPDHVLITGDLTTTALPAEFADARRGLERLLTEPAAATVIPGNHDRYTRASVRTRAFEREFGAFAPGPESEYPWLKWLDQETAILCLDASRPHLTARGFLPFRQIEAARTLLETAGTRLERLIVACHYPLAAPPGFQAELARKRLGNQATARAWIATLGRHIYCCGHVHAAWAFVPPELPEQLCLNAGAPLLRHRDPSRRPGFLEIEIERDGAVRVSHHAWGPPGWERTLLYEASPFFKPQSDRTE